jgi:hypothetical protein
MSDNWYAAEQEVRDRISEAREAARIRTLTRELAPTARRPYAVGITIIRLASWVLARWMSTVGHGGRRHSRGRHETRGTASP